jgi:hypothetical protein
MMHPFWSALLLAPVFAALPFASCAVESFHGVQSQPVVIWSQGTRLEGRLWRPEEAARRGEARPDVYRKRYGRASDLAIEWFQEHLSGDGS